MVYPCNSLQAYVASDGWPRRVAIDTVHSRPLGGEHIFVVPRIDPPLYPPLPLPTNVHPLCTIVPVAQIPAEKQAPEARRTGSEGDLLVRKSSSHSNRASANDEGPTPTRRVRLGDVEQYRDIKASGNDLLERLAGASPLGAAEFVTTPAQRRRGGGRGGGSVRRKPSVPSRSERKPSRCERAKRCGKRVY